VKIVLSVCPRTSEGEVHMRKCACVQIRIEHACCVLWTQGS
jgi:hypothetical protein